MCSNAMAFHFDQSLHHLSVTKYQRKFRLHKNIQNDAIFVIIIMRIVKLEILIIARSNKQWASVLSVLLTINNIHKVCSAVKRLLKCKQVKSKDMCYLLCKRLTDFVHFR